MAQAKIKRRQQINSVRTEFAVPEARIFAELLDPDQVLVTDQWEFVSAGEGGGIIIVRVRNTVKAFDIDGNDIP